MQWCISASVVYILHTNYKNYNNNNNNNTIIDACFAWLMCVLVCVRRLLGAFCVARECRRSVFSSVFLSFLRNEIGNRRKRKKYGIEYMTLML